jgi:putative DNA primase/helicase
MPDIRIIICADDDYRTAGNTGVTKANEAARAVRGLVAIPDFGDYRPDGATDLNDLARHHGAGTVKQAVANARAPDVEGQP